MTSNIIHKAHCKRSFFIVKINAFVAINLYSWVKVAAITGLLVAVVHLIVVDGTLP